MSSQLRQPVGSCQCLGSRKIVIVGGGAAGFFAAMAAAEKAKENKLSVEISILENSDNILKKVKISGGGRCNVTHNCFEVRQFCQNYPRGEKELISAMQRFQAKDTLAWFAARGVTLVPEEDGRMFPDTDSSQTIIDCFLNECERLGVKVLKNHSVQSVEKLTVGLDKQTGDVDAVSGADGGVGAASDGKARFRINIKDREPMEAHSVLIATGSSPAGYRIAQELGHTISELAPSLFSFKISDFILEELSGLSFPQAEVRLVVDGGVQFKERGPILITHWGLSGPAVLKISAWAAREMMHADYKAVFYVNWLGLKNRESVDELLKKIKSENLKSQVNNVYPKELAKRFWLKIIDLSISRSGGSGGGVEGKNWADVSNKELNKMSEVLFSTRLTVLGKNRFKDEFVECGGVNLKEINFKRMESKICSGLYFAGELLDIDGITGGFNFQNAWTGGWIAGQSMSE